MKKITTTAVLLLLAVWSNAQAIPNGGFEAWTNNIIYEDPNEWTTLNFFSAFGLPVTVSSGTPAPEGSKYAHMETTGSEAIGDTVRGLLEENATARAGLRVTAGLLGATVLLLPVVVWRLRATGKAGDEILWPAFLGWPLLAGALLAALWWQDRHRLLPRRRHLEALRQELEERAD